MSLILIVLAIFFVLMIVSPRIKTQRVNHALEDLQLEVHKYSGLNPDIYYEFENNLNLMQTTVQEDPELAKEYLYMSIQNIEDLSLYSSGSNTEVIDELLHISKQIGFEGEKMLIDVDHQFIPRYLNNLS